MPRQAEGRKRWSPWTSKLTTPLPLSTHQRSPLTSKLTTPPKPLICFFAIAWSGWLSRPGYHTRSILVRLEPPGDVEARRVVSLHAQVQRLEAAQQQVGSVGVHNTAHDVVERADLRGVEAEEAVRRLQSKC